MLKEPDFVKITTTKSLYCIDEMLINVYLFYLTIGFVDELNEAIFKNEGCAYDV